MNPSSVVPPIQLDLYQDWLARQRGRHFDSYDALWQWSVDDPQGFWASLWDYFNIESPTPVTRVLAEPRMPGARWFEGTQVNYARQVLRHVEPSQAARQPALLFRNELLQAQDITLTLSWPELRRQVASLALNLRELGVGRGDRVAAFLPNTPLTLVAFLACASIGAVWSLCAPELGALAVLDRLRQIEPKVLICCDGCVHGGREHDLRARTGQIIAGLPSLREVLFWPYLDASNCAGPLQPEGSEQDGQVIRIVRPNQHPPQLHDLRSLLADDGDGFEPDWLPFDHPLWIVYSSGTTGLPKPIVHGHGGVILEGLKMNVLHNDLAPSAVQPGERFFWHTSPSWIMWNCQVNGLLGGTTLCLYDGHPAGSSEAPDWSRLWRFAAATGVSFFGAGAAFYENCHKAGLELAGLGLERLRAVGSTGSPLAERSADWLQTQLRQPDGTPIWLSSISGGTDIAGAFFAGHRGLPMQRGELQCRCLGAAVEAWSPPDAQGRGAALPPGEVGELVCTRPLPSMPLQLWGDPDGRRYRESYFESYAAGPQGPVWRHGDWLRLVPHPEHGVTGAIILGRSDATLNRHGIRIGTAEIYRVVEHLPEVSDSLVIDLEYPDRPGLMPLFVVLREGLSLDAALEQRLREQLRTHLSARHVPDRILQVSHIPRTLSNKKMELPVRQLLLGAPPAQVLSRDTLLQPAAADEFIALAAQFEPATT